MGKILVTGATGNVGLEVIRLLANRDRSVVAGVRNISKAQKILGEQIEYVELDFMKEETYKQALMNVEKIFLVRPPQIADVQKYIFPFIEQAKKEGVKKIVFLSLLGVEKNRVVPHYKIEKYILESGIDYTFLRASFFMQNLNTTHLVEIRDENEIFIPAGKGKTSFIDVRDIAEVGAMALTEAGHEQVAYSLTGDQALDYGEVAKIFTDVLGREIVYAKPSICKFYRRMRRKGTKPGFILIMIALYTTARLGLAKKTTDELEKLLGRKPTSVREYVEDYRDDFIP